MESKSKTVIFRYFFISIFYVVIFLIFSFTTVASNITKDFPPSAEPEVIIPVGFNITTDAGSSVIIIETIPADSQITNWSVTGAENSNSISPKIETTSQGTTYTWTFTASTSNPTLKYDAKSSSVSTSSSDIFETGTSYAFPDKSGTIASKLVIMNKPFDQMSAEAQQLLLSQQTTPETKSVVVSPEKKPDTNANQQPSTSPTDKTSANINVSDNTLTWFMVIAIVAVVFAAGYVIYVKRKSPSQNEPPSFS